MTSSTTSDHFTLADLDWVPVGRHGQTRAAVLLDVGDTAVNPASTKHLIHGPAWVIYDRYPDGGLDVHVDAS